MKNIKRTRITISTFGSILGIAGIEHGVGEILQGNIKPDSLFILSWPDNKLYEILAGEPAFTLIPNMLITGITAICISLLMIIWSIGFIERKHGAAGLLLFSLLMFLFGAGFAGPILIGLVLSIAAVRMNRTKVDKKTDSQRFYKLANRIWTGSYWTSLLSWLFLWPGVIIYIHIVGSFYESVIYFFIILSFISLLSAVISGLVRDRIKPLE